MNIPMSPASTHSSSTSRCIALYNVGPITVFIMISPLLYCVIKLICRSEMLFIPPLDGGVHQWRRWKPHMFNHMIFQLLNWVESIRKGRVMGIYGSYHRNNAFKLYNIHPIKWTTNCSNGYRCVDIVLTLFEEHPSTFPGRIGKPLHKCYTKHAS